VAQMVQIEPGVLFQQNAGTVIATVGAFTKSAFFQD
jgi:hypothetical protein